MENLTAELLHIMIRDSLTKASNLNISEGLKSTLDMLCSKVQKIRVLNSEGTRKIGVFGAPKRGKSTLINVLLGHNILPTHPLPMSSTIVELRQDNHIKDWELFIIKNDGSAHTLTLKTEQHVASYIKQYGSHKFDNNTAETIEIRAPFNKSNILGQGGILVDTPGAEPAFIHENSPTYKDTQKAVDMLKNVHVVIFCIRTDQIGTEKEATFFTDFILPLNPLVIINFKDTWDSTEEKLENLVIENNFPLDRCVFISSKMAEEASNEDDRIRSGIPQLEEKITEEINNLTPQKGILNCLNIYNSIIERSAIHKQDIRPHKIYTYNLINYLESHVQLQQGDNLAQKILSQIKKI